ncbi:hypothetical protein IG631_19416 [Alternaria alternata]|nr:hypothetical protein IG631_19416 [Alternaria alternata]
MRGGIIECSVPVVLERWPSFVTTVVLAGVAVFAHAVDGSRDGRFAGRAKHIDRRLPRIAACGSTVQARARSNCREPISAKAGVPWAVCVTPLPTRVSSTEVDMTWRRQGWWCLFACL